MPVTSPKQFRFMQAAKAGRLKGTGGPSPAVASEFLNATPEATKSSFASADRFTSALKKKRKNVLSV